MKRSVASCRKMYRIREVDASDDEIAETIRDFNRMEPNFPALKDEELEGEHCYWWLAYCGKEPVAFAGVVPSKRYNNTGYLKRAGVVPEHRGHGLQLRFFRVREIKARKVGWEWLISECTDTIHSANNFIRAGYLMFEPVERWAFQNSLYWRKKL
jgi:GNAT superfamily N-acetyltransferase